MQSALVTFTLLFAPLWVCSGASEHSTRVKRLIGGGSISDSERSAAPFKALDYFVWIGFGWHRIENSFWCNLFPSCIFARQVVNYFLEDYFPLEDPQKQLCGGALITPDIVQTACHCVAEFSHSENPNHYWDEAVVISAWEDLMYVYMGKSNVLAFKYEIRTSRSFTHPKCSSLSGVEFIQYDVAWMTLEGPVYLLDGMTTGNWGKLDYAGPYASAPLIEFSQRVLSQRHTCLIMGYGVTDEIKNLTSSKIKYGWITMLDYQLCYDVLWKSAGLDQALPDYTLGWACSTPLYDPSDHGRLGVRPALGDSGGPITCGNDYFAVHSGYTGIVPPALGFEEIYREFPVYFSLESITVEHRIEFELDVQKRDTYRSREGSEEDLRAIPFNGTIGYPIHKFEAKDYKINQSTSPSTQRSSAIRSSPSVWAYFIYIFQFVATPNRFR